MTANTLCKLCLCVFIFPSCVSANKDDFEEITVLANSSVRVPCRVASDGREAAAIIVLWYRSGSQEPFYSYDLRQRGGGRHWSDDTVLGRRAHFESRRHPLSLVVDPARPEDEAVYRCRVDYEKGPSKTFSVKLNVVSLPSVPVITDEGGNLVRGEVGPYRERGRVVLTCKTIGGHPSPSLVWLREGQVGLREGQVGLQVGLREGQVVDDSFDGDTGGRVRNLFHIESLSRDFLDATFVCRAFNNNITNPLDTFVTIKITLAPLTVTLRRLNGAQDFVQENRRERLECVTTGSYPAPVLTWWRDGRLIHDPELKEGSSKSTNETRSVLKLRPLPGDVGVIITCRVENPLLPGSVLEETFRLNVHYVPRVTLTMGLGLDQRAVREGSDVFMECNVKANPNAFRISWMHENEEIRHNLTSGILIANRTLVLQKIQKERTGDYWCEATNSQGSGASSPIILSIMYAPYCKEGLQETYQVSRHSVVNIACEVEARPTNVTFRWQFNSSAGVKDVTDRKIVRTNESFSQFAFSTDSFGGEYGSLLCAASNFIGAQDTPCVFNVTPAQPPELLESCEIRNQSSHSVFVTCKSLPTELPTSFTMEARASDDQGHVTTVHNSTPAFLVSGLTPGTAYVLHVMVNTPIGVSQPIKLTAFTVKTAEKRMGITDPESAELRPEVIGAAAAVLLTFLLLLAALVRSCSLRDCETHRRDKPDGKSYAPAEILTFTKQSPIVDQNPDIIPPPIDRDYKLEELRISISPESSLGSAHNPALSLPVYSHIHDVTLLRSTLLTHQQHLLYSHSAQRSASAQKGRSGLEVTLDRSATVQGCPHVIIPYAGPVGQTHQESIVPTFPPPEGFRGNSPESQLEFPKNRVSSETESKLHHESSV